MAVTRKEKEATLASLTEQLKNARGVVFAEYRGMTVKQLDNVRKNLRKENVTYQVVKVTLLKKALATLGISTDNLKYSGPIALAVSNEEETAPARILKGMTKENPQLILDGGVFNHELVGAEIILKTSLSSNQTTITRTTAFGIARSITWIGYGALWKYSQLTECT
jgi:large subunit ribosomal protein L10